MDIRAQVYSPLQNTAVWLGAWLYGRVATDDLLSALKDLGGTHVISKAELPVTELLRVIREETRGAVDDGPGEPILRLLLSGPGEAPALPAGSAAAQATASSSTGALLIGGQEGYQVLIPETFEVDTLTSKTIWTSIEVEGVLPASQYLSPGEADYLLADATRVAAELIQQAGVHNETLPDPRLTVGSLSDFYDTPGLPDAVAPRAAKLFARADVVAAIIETLTVRAGDHRFDAELFTLWRHIRAARMAGVEYAVREFSRG